jgi:hypothetical protein
MLTTILTAIILAVEPAPSIGATEITHACESPSVERPALAMPAPEWAFVVVPERACDETASAAQAMLELDINPFDAVERADIELPDAGVDAPQETP